MDEWDQIAQEIQRVSSTPASVSGPALFDVEPPPLPTTTTTTSSDLKRCLVQKLGIQNPSEIFLPKFYLRFELEDRNSKKGFFRAISHIQRIAASSFQISPSEIEISASPSLGENGVAEELKVAPADVEFIEDSFKHLQIWDTSFSLLVKFEINYFRKYWSSEDDKKNFQIQLQQELGKAQENLKETDSEMLFKGLAISQVAYVSRYVTVISFSGGGKGQGEEEPKMQTNVEGFSFNVEFQGRSNSLGKTRQTLVSWAKCEIPNAIYKTIYEQRGQQLRYEIDQPHFISESFSLDLKMKRSTTAFVEPWKTKAPRNRAFLTTLPSFGYTTPRPVATETEAVGTSSVEEAPSELSGDVPPPPDIPAPPSAPTPSPVAATITATATPSAKAPAQTGDFVAEIAAGFKLKKRAGGGLSAGQVRATGTTPASAPTATPTITAPTTTTSTTAPTTQPQSRVPISLGETQLRPTTRGGGASTSFTSCTLPSGSVISGEQLFTALFSREGAFVSRLKLSGLPFILKQTKPRDAEVKASTEIPALIADDMNQANQIKKFTEYYLGYDQVSGQKSGMAKFWVSEVEKLSLPCYREPSQDFKKLSLWISNNIRVTVKEVEKRNPTDCDSATEKECQDAQGKKLCVQKDLCAGITSAATTTVAAATNRGTDWWKD